MNFRVEIKNKEASAVAGYIVCGNSDYSITFAFDSEWAALPVKTARFVYTQDDQVKYKDVVFEGVTVEVPILRDITEVFVGVFAGELHTTTPLRIACKKSILCGVDSIQDEPTPDVYAQILELVNTKIVGERELPAVTADDKDKVLAVNENGEWEEVDKAPKAQSADNAANSEKLGGFHYYDLFKSAYDYVNKTSGLKYSLEIPASKIQEIGGDNNTYIPVFIPLPAGLNGDNDYGKAMPCRISITKNIRQSSPPFPNPSVGGNYNTDYASLWLQYEGRALVWDGNCGYVRTIYASDPYPHLCLKTDIPKYYRSGLIVWLRAGTNRSSQYTIYSNYPITGNTPAYYVDANGNRDTSYDFANVQPIYEEKDIGVKDGGTGKWYSYVVKPENVPDEKYNSGLYNRGVLNIAQDGNGEEYMGYATESVRVNGINPSVYNRSHVIFKANTLTEIDLQIAVGAYVKEEYSDDGSKIYVFYSVTDVNAGLKTGASFDYSGELVEVVSDEAGGLLLKFEKGGALASLSGQTVTIGKRTVGSEAEELPVNRAVNSAQVNGLEITKQANGAITIGGYTGVGAEILTKKVRVVEGNNASVIDLSGFTEGWYEFDLVEPETANRLMFRAYYIPATENLEGRLICSNAPCVAYGGVDNNGAVQIISSTFYINSLVPIGGQYSLAGPAVNRTIIDLNGTTAEVQKLVTYQCKGIYKIVE